MNLHRRSATGVRRAGAIGLIVVAALLMSGVTAEAAGLSFMVDTPIRLASPAITLTITAGSTADSLAVGSGNIVVIVPGGSEFMVTSASRGLTASGAGVSVSCSSQQVAQVDIAPGRGTVDSQTVTITPTSELCAVPGVIGAGGGGGGGGGAAYVAPVTTPAPTSTTTTATTTTTAATTAAPSVTGAAAPSAAATALRQQQVQLLNLLIMQLQALVLQAKAQGIALPAGTEAVVSQLAANVAPAAGTSAFTRDLQVGSKGDDVNLLQNFLITQNAGPAAQALAANGATTYFGNLTMQALAEYQQSIGISPAAGYFGPKTRAYLKTLGQ